MVGGQFNHTADALRKGGLFGGENKDIPSPAVLGLLLALEAGIKYSEVVRVGCSVF